ncbi:hypothetical protein CRG98_003744, partial [Punica granatum]
MGVTCSGRLYENPAAANKGKASAVEVEAIPGAPPTSPKKVTEEEAEAFMKIIKASEYKVVEQMAKSPAHVSLLALLLSSKPHREALLRVLTAAQVPKGTPPDQIEETVSSIFSNTISFSDDELPSEGCAHSRALHIVCKCNNHIVGRVMIDNGSALNIGPSSANRMIGKVLLRHNYILGTGLRAHGQRINRPIEVEEYKNRRGLGFRPSCHEIVEARRGNHLHRLAAHYGRLDRGIQVSPLSHFFPGPPHIIGSALDGPSSDSDDAPTAPPTVLHSNPNFRHVDSNPFEECLGEPGPIYFGEGLDEDSQVPEIEESLRRLEERQLTSLEPTKEINVGTENEPRTLKIGTGLDPTQRARMIDFLVMPFGLKNAGATYQRAMVTLFHDMMHKEIEVYVDDMIAKSREGEDHLVNLERLFDRLKKYKLRLNLAKCTFGARSGKLLGFVDSMLINPDFPDEGILQVDGEEEKPKWKMYFDGAVNSTGSGIGAVLISPDGLYYPVAAKIEFPCTNNKTKDAKLVPYHEYLERLTEYFEDISFTYTPRMKNQFASMVSITRENLIEPLEIMIAKGPAHCNAIEASEAKPWYEDIRNFLRTGQYPPFADRRDRKTLKRLAIHYFLSGKILYRRSFDSTLL